MTLRGLWPRVRYDRSVSLAKAVVLYAAAAGLALTSIFLPSDVGYVVLKKRA
jgi:hypothetical protein